MKGTSVMAKGQFEKVYRKENKMFIYLVIQYFSTSIVGFCRDDSKIEYAYLDCTIAISFFEKKD